MSKLCQENGKNLNLKSIDRDKKISIALMSSFSVLALQYLILTYFNLMGTQSANRIQLISKLIVGFLYLMALPIVLKRNKFKFAAIYFISIFVFLLNFLFFPDNWPYLVSIIFPYFFICIPSLVYSYSINDWNVLADIMKNTGNFVFIVSLAIGILALFNKASIGAYSMTLSYYMLLPTIIYLNEFLERLSIKHFFAILISIFIIISLGSRGPILCIGVFAVLKLVQMGKKLSRKTLFIYILILFVNFAFLLSFDTILQNLSNFLLRFGIHSRTVALFLRNDIYLSGRDYLYKNMIYEIIENPIFGIGLTGDRRVIGGYSHNIFIEILSGFGIIIGSIVILLLATISYRALFTKNRALGNFTSIWFCVGAVSLMVSGSYLTDFQFWIFLGLAIKLLHTSKNQKIVSKTYLKVNNHN